MNFKNKLVIITGGSSGIGAAAAEQFARKGANIVLISRRKEKLDKIEKKLLKYKVKIQAIQCDVSKKSEVKNMSNFVLENFNKIDILVNNAGFAIYGSVNDLSIEEIEAQMLTNYFGMIYCIKNFLPKMLEQGYGHIINVASVAGSFGLPGIASYCASKFAMLGFSEGLKHELKGTKIGVTVVSPIMVKTNFFDHPSFKKMPKYSPTSLSPETVAKAVIKAANSSRLEITVPSVVRAIIWTKHTFPYLINPILGSSFRKQLESKSG